MRPRSRRSCQRCPPARRRVDVVGFHGHTLFHRPAEHRTCQLGDGERLAARLGIDVVYDFRSADVAAGGQGAPLAPVFHQALAAALEKPAGDAQSRRRRQRDLDRRGEPIAFDTGPGNGLIDDWVRARTDQPYDEGGRIAAAGRIDEARLARAAGAPVLRSPPPKSLDRLDFTLAPVEGLGLEDGAATLAAFTAQAVARALRAPAGAATALAGHRRRPAQRHADAHARGRAGACRSSRSRRSAPMAMRWRRRRSRSWRCVRSAACRSRFPATTGVPAPLCGGRLARATGSARRARG